MNRVNTNQLYTTSFTFWMLIAHIVVGVVGLAPFVVFGVAHWWTARKRDNRVAVRLGVILLPAGAGRDRVGLRARSDRGLTATPDRNALADHHLPGPPARADRLHLRVHRSPPRRAGDQMEVREVLGRDRGHRGGRYGGGPRHRSAEVRPRRAGGGNAVLLPVRVPHRGRQVHPRQRDDDGRVLQEVPPGHLQRPLPLGPQVQLVQQPGVPVQRPRDAQGRRWSATAT